MNGAYLWGQFKHVDPLSYLSGRLDRDAYIERYRPEYAAIRYANDEFAKSHQDIGYFSGKPPLLQ